MSESLQSSIGATRNILLRTRVVVVLGLKTTQPTPSTTKMRLNRGHTTKSSPEEPLVISTAPALPAVQTSGGGGGGGFSPISAAASPSSSVNKGETETAKRKRVRPKRYRSDESNHSPLTPVAAIGATPKAGQTNGGVSAPTSGGGGGASSKRKSRPGRIRLRNKQLTPAPGSVGSDSNILLSELKTLDLILLAPNGANSPAVGNEEEMHGCQQNESGKDDGDNGELLKDVVTEQVWQEVHMSEGDDAGHIVCEGPLELNPAEAVDAGRSAEKVVSSELGGRKQMIEENQVPLTGFLPLSTDKGKVEIDGFFLSKKYLPLYIQLRERHGMMASDLALVDPTMRGKMVKWLLQIIVEMNESVGRVSDSRWKKWEQYLASAENVKFNVSWLGAVLTKVKAQHDSLMHLVDVEEAKHQRDVAASELDAAKTASDAAQHHLDMAQRTMFEAEEALRKLEDEARKLGGLRLADASLFLE